jgi:hypothetical protein
MQIEEDEGLSFEMPNYELHTTGKTIGILSNDVSDSRMSISFKDLVSMSDNIPY